MRYAPRWSLTLGTEGGAVIRSRQLGKRAEYRLSYTSLAGPHPGVMMPHKYLTQEDSPKEKWASISETKASNSVMAVNAWSDLNLRNFLSKSTCASRCLSRNGPRLAKPGKVKWDCADSSL